MSLPKNPVEWEFENKPFASQLHAVCTELLQGKQLWFLFTKRLTWLYCPKSESQSWIRSAEISTLLFLESKTKNAAFCEAPSKMLHCPAEQLFSACT